MTIKTGIVRIVSKNGGLIFEDEPDTWYNPIKAARHMVADGLKGQNIEVRLVEGKTLFVDLKVMPLPNTPKTTLEAASQPSPYDARDARITRAGALNTALQAISIATAGQHMTATPEAIMEKAEALAEERVIPFIRKTR